MSKVSVAYVYIAGEGVTVVWVGRPVLVFNLDSMDNNSVDMVAQVQHGLATRVHTRAHSWVCIWAASHAVTSILLCYPCLP